MSSSLRSIAYTRQRKAVHYRSVTTTSARKRAVRQEIGDQESNHSSVIPPSSLSSQTAICIWIPHFPLRAEERRRRDIVQKPAAIVSPTDTRRLWQVSPIARRQGVRAGMTVSQAIGLCSMLTILEPDPVYYDEQFSTLLLTLTKISPVVEPVELGRVYVGADGLDRLLGNTQSQLKAVARVIDGASTDKHKREHTSIHPGEIHRGKRRWIRGRASARRTTPDSECITNDSLHWNGLRLGWGRGKFASWVAACRAKPGQPLIITDEERDSFLQSQSVAVLPIESDTHRRLWQLGIKTLGALAALPVEAIVSQFGHEGRVAWQLAAGLVVEPVTGQPPPENIVTHIEFPLPVADRGILTYAIGKLVDRALRDPRRIGWRVYSLRVQARLEHGSSWLADVTLKDPSADSQRICAPISAKLEQAPPNGAVEEVTVEFTSLIRGTSELQLFARDSSSVARAGRHRALRWASKEIQKRLKRSMLHHIIEVHPWSRLPERRYALIDYDP